MILRLIAVGLLLAGPAAAQSPAGGDAFRAFIEALRTDARTRGVSNATFDRAFAGVTADSRVIAATKRQPEYGKPAGAYVNGIVSASRAAEGRQLEMRWRQILASTEQRFGVDRWIVLAIWGMETSFGAVKPQWDAVRSLASLASIRYRDEFFREELLEGLRILQEGHISRDGFKASWAGAMGQPQFMPSSFRKFAVDFDGDGKRDIWNSVPDVLGSISGYLEKHNWRRGVPWGFEVSVPPGFDLMRSRASFAEWTKLGVRRADGSAFPAAGDGILFYPAGAPGPAFVVTSNFDALKAYNDSDVYALAIGLLADRMQGGGPIRTPWPTQATQLPRDDRIALQRKLADLGYPQTRFTAHIDFDMRDHVRAEQKKHGLTPDGHPSPELMRKLGLKGS